MTDGSPARLEHAKALVALGAALRRVGKRSEAREPLRLGLESAARYGAGRLAEHAQTELYAAGGRPRRAALTGPESLTPSERRVAELAAAGQANRDIAQALYVTPKTVEFHLTSTYRKLEITTRAGRRSWRTPPRPDGPRRVGRRSLGVGSGGVHDARALPSVDARPMSREPVQIVIDVRVDDDEISGHAGDRIVSGGRSRAGWG